jgi:hypothetical protein
MIGLLVVTIAAAFFALSFPTPDSQRIWRANCPVINAILCVEVFMPRWLKYILLLLILMLIAGIPLAMQVARK